MSKLEELKREVINILLKQDKEEKQVKKAFEYEDFFNQYKKNFGELDAEVEKGKLANIGEVRTWKGKKYKKIAPGKWARMYEKEGRGTNIAVGKLIAKVKKIDDIEELMNFVMQNKQRFQDENGKDLPILDKIRAAVDEQNKKISSGDVGSKGKTVEDKVKENPDYPFKPMTDKERAERAAFEKDRDDFIERMDKIRQENKKKDKDFSKYSISELEKIKKDAMEKYKNAKTEEEEDAAIEIRNKANAQIRIHNYVKLPMKRVLNTIVSNEDKENYLTERIKDTKINIQKLEESIKRTTNANNRNTKIDKLNELKENEKGFEQLLNELLENTEKKKEEKQQNNKQGKIPSGYVNDLSIEKQGELHKLLKEHFIKEGMSGMEIADALDNAMDSKISDLEEIYNKNKEVKKLLMNTDSDSSSFKLSDIYDRNTHDKMKQVQSFDEAKNVIKQIADNYGPTEKGRKLLENFMSYNVGGSNPIYDKVYEHFGISYNDLDADFDAAKNKILKLASGQKNVSKEDKKIQQGKDDFASRYRAAIEQEDKNFQKKEGSKTDGKTENTEKKEESSDSLREKYKEKDKEYSEILQKLIYARNHNQDTSKYDEKVTKIHKELSDIENKIKNAEEREVKRSGKPSDFTLDDINSQKTVKTIEDFEDVIKEIDKIKDDYEAADKYMDFWASNIEGGFGGKLHRAIRRKYKSENLRDLAREVKGKKPLDTRDVSYADEYANIEEEKKKSFTPKVKKSFSEEIQDILKTLKK